MTYSPGGVDDRESRATRRLFICILVGGALVPWVTGACVKLYRDAHDAWTWPWSAFLGPGRLGLGLFLTAIWALPYAALAGIARDAFHGEPLPFLGSADMRRRRAVVSCSLVGGWIVSARFFWSLFWDFQEMSLVAGAPFLIFYVGIGMIAGWTAGILGVHAVAFFARRRHD